MSVVYFLDREYPFKCDCCCKDGEYCRPVWVNPSDLKFLCPSCFGFVVALICNLDIEFKKGGD